MGSNTEEPPLQEDDEITVLVTGFAPFRQQYPINPAWEIARSLPPFLPPSSSSSSSTTLTPPRVRILVYPSPIKVSYDAVRALVPSLWKGRKIDYAIHIGMASGRKYYSVERRGHRDGYYGRDVDNEFLGDEGRREKEGKDWVWEGMPEEILSDVDVDDVWRRWRVALPETDVRVSEDAGRYLCDFIYFSSLAYLTKKKEEKRVVFLHVPVETEERHIAMGIEATIELIRAIVQSGQLKNITAPIPNHHLSQVPFQA